MEILGHVPEDEENSEPTIDDFRRKYLDRASQGADWSVIGPERIKFYFASEAESERAPNRQERILLHNIRVLDVDIRCLESITNGEAKKEIRGLVEAGAEALKGFALADPYLTDEQVDLAVKIYKQSQLALKQNPEEIS